MTSATIIADQFALHTRLFNNVLEDVDESGSRKQVTAHINHLQWIAGHLAHIRYNHAFKMGVAVSFPFKELYVDPSQPPPGNRPIDPALEYPALTELVRLWNTVSLPFVEAVSNLNESQLGEVLSFKTPIRNNTMLGLLGFLSSHESYHIGQMSIIRKSLGLGSMTYK